MKLKNSQKTLKCVAKFAQEKDLCNTFITPIILDIIERPVLNEQTVKPVAMMMKEDEHIASFGLPGAITAIYAMDVHEQKGLCFESSSDEDLVIGGIAKYGRLFSGDELRSNPYIKNIMIPKTCVKNGSYSFKKKLLRPVRTFHI